MGYPKRPEEHIKEEIAINVFKKLIHNSWIVFDVRNQDYGYDLLLSIVSKQNQVLPNMIGFQIKYQGNIDAPLSIKRSTYNYLSKSNIPSFIFATNEEYTKILFMNNINKTGQGHTVSFGNNDFIKINGSNQLIDLICFDSYLKIKEVDNIQNIQTGIRIFPDILKSLVDNNIVNKQKLYSENMQLIHDICIYNYRGIDLFRVYIKRNIPFIKLKSKLILDSEINDILLVFLIILSFSSNKFNTNLQGTDRDNFIIYLKEITGGDNLYCV